MVSHVLTRTHSNLIGGFRVCFDNLVHLVRIYLCVGVFLFSLSQLMGVSVLRCVLGTVDEFM